MEKIKVIVCDLRSYVLTLLQPYGRVAHAVFKCTCCCSVMKKIHMKTKQKLSLSFFCRHVEESYVQGHIRVALH